MKKFIFIIAMCTFALYPIGGHAQTNGHDGPHLIPPSIAWNISFNDLTGVLSIDFTRVIPSADILIQSLYPKRDNFRDFNLSCRSD